jgi:hypothetical protein
LIGRSPTVWLRLHYPPLGLAQQPVVGGTAFGGDPNDLINAYGVLGLDRDVMWKLTRGSFRGAR